MPFLAAAVVEVSTSCSDIGQSVIIKAVTIVVEAIADLRKLARLGRTDACDPLGGALGLPFLGSANAFVTTGAFLEEPWVRVGAWGLGVAVVVIDLAIAVVVDVVPAVLDGGLSRGERCSIQAGWSAFDLTTIGGITVAIDKSRETLPLEFALHRRGRARGIFVCFNALSLCIGEGCIAVCFAGSAGSRGAEIDPFVDIPIAVIVDPIAVVVCVRSLLAWTEFTAVRRIFIEIVIVRGALRLGCVVAAGTVGAGDCANGDVLHYFGAVIVACATGSHLGGVAVGIATTTVVFSADVDRAAASAAAFTS